MERIKRVLSLIEKICPIRVSVVRIRLMPYVRFPVALFVWRHVEVGQDSLQGWLESLTETQNDNEFESKFVEKNRKDHDVIDEGSLGVLRKSRKRTNSNGSSGGNGGVVKVLKHHDIVDEGSLEGQSKSRRKTNPIVSPKEMVWP